MSIARIACQLAWENKTIGAFELPGWAIWLRCLELGIEEVLSELSLSRISEIVLRIFSHYIGCETHVLGFSIAG